jgi:hypothetical protein
MVSGDRGRTTPALSRPRPKGARGHNANRHCFSELETTSTPSLDHAIRGQVALATYGHPLPSSTLQIDVGPQPAGILRCQPLKSDNPIVSQEGVWSGQLAYLRFAWSRANQVALIELACQS